MKAVEFEGFNVVYGKNQPQYNNLPAFVDPEGTEERSVLYCYELTFEEIQQVVKDRRIYGLQMIGSGGFNPVNCFVKNPLLINDEKDTAEEVEVLNEIAPSAEEVNKMLKINNPEHEVDEVIHKNLQIRIDETFDLELTKDELQLFIKHAEGFLKDNDWFEIQDTTGKAFYFQLRKFIKENEIFREDVLKYEIKLDYLHIWVVNRFCRIAQIRINEENDEQRFFQRINQLLFDLI